MSRPKSAKDKELADNTRLLRAWKKFHREERDAVLAGPHGPVLIELFRMLDHLELVQPSQLLGVARDIDWAVVSYDVKLTTIHEINSAITRLRTRCKLEPIDDNLPGEPDTPYRQLKAILFSPPQEGAHRGVARPE